MYILRKRGHWGADVQMGCSGARALFALRDLTDVGNVPPPCSMGAAAFGAVVAVR
jgi:hypothetical protein